MRPYLPLVECCFQLIPQRIAVGPRPRHVGRIAAQPPRPVAQRLIRRHLCGIQQGRSVRGRRAVTQTESHRTGHINPRPVQADWRRQRRLQPRANLHDVFQIKPPHRAQNHGKAAAFQPRHHVARPQTRAQPFGAARQNLGLRRAAMAVQQGLRLIKLHHRTGRCQPVDRRIAQNRVHHRHDLRAHRQPPQRVRQAGRGAARKPERARNCEQQGRAKCRDDQQAFAARPKRRQRQGRDEHHQFGLAKLRQRPAQAQDGPGQTCEHKSGSLGAARQAATGQP